MNQHFYAQTDSRYLQNLQTRQAFTLVELIVVIAILAILGTIGFVSIQGYSSRSRDSVRVTALNNTITALEIAQTRSGRYPIPDNSFQVTYSGATVWTQGLIGSGVLTQLSSDGMTQAPTDPLTRTQYGYSVLAFGPIAHQIRIEYEGDLVANAPRQILGADTVYAESGNPTIVGIKGNYSGRFMAQTQTGGLIYVLALPSIVTNTGSLGGPSIDIAANTLSGTLLLNASPKATGLAYNPNKLVYTGATLPTDDSTGQVTLLFTNLRAAYTGTVLQSNRAISPIYALTATDTPVTGPVIMNNQLGKGVSLGVVASSSSNFCTAGGTIPCIIGP